jgi:hypothetical protein
MSPLFVNAVRPTIGTGSSSPLPNIATNYLVVSHPSSTGIWQSIRINMYFRHNLEHFLFCPINSNACFPLYA